MLRHRQHSSLAALRQTPEASHLMLQVHSVSLSLLSGRGVSTCRALQVRHTADTRKRQSRLSTTASHQHQPAAQPHGDGSGRRDTQTLGMHRAHDRHLANRRQHSKSAHLLSISLGAVSLWMGLVIKANHPAPFISTVSSTITSFTPGWLTDHTPADQLQSLSLVNLTKETFLNVITYFSVLFTFFPLTNCVIDADRFFGCQTM